VRLRNVELTHAIVRHYEGTLTKLYPALFELRQSRDKIIAHNEAIERSALQSLTWGAALSLVEYAKDFVSTIGFGYLSTLFGRARETNDLLVAAVRRPEVTGYRDARGEPRARSGNWGRRGDHDGGIRARA
jgi:hypothetical protein